MTFSCDQCAHTTKQRGTLKQHKEAKHEGMKYYCDQCQYQTGWAKGLRRHKTVKHSSLG